MWSYDVPKPRPLPARSPAAVRAQLVIGYTLLVLTWGVYLIFVTARPAWQLRKVNGKGAE